MAAEGSGKFADIESLRQHIIQQCDVLGYTISSQSAQNKTDGFEINRNDENISVQIKNHRAKTNIAEVCKFTEFLDLDQCSHLSGGWLISTSGFSKPALTHVRTERPSNLRLGTSTPYGIRWNYDPLGEDDLAADESFGFSDCHSQQPITYIGVFTCKGGVGKTTVAAHLAGAFALQGSTCSWWTWIPTGICASCSSKIKHLTMKQLRSMFPPIAKASSAAQSPC